MHQNQCTCDNKMECYCYNGSSLKTNSLFIYLFSVLIAPIVFYIYLKNNLVCEPRAVLSSFLFGMVPFVFIIIAIFKKNMLLNYIAMVLLFFEIISTPFIMINKLGMEKFIDERLLAFFTFEFFALLQLSLAIFIVKYKKIDR